MPAPAAYPPIRSALESCQSDAGQPTHRMSRLPDHAPTATSTPRGGAAVEAEIQPTQSDTARINGVLQWTFQGVSPIISQLAPSSDGNLYFLTADGDLHALDAKGRERWSRRATGNSIAVSPDGPLYALGADGTLQALSAIGKPLWSMSAASGFGPLAASSGAVYFQEDRQLVAASSPGVMRWRATAPDDITSAAIADDGTIVAAANGASVVAIASDGSRQWSFTPHGGFAGEIAIRGNLVYLGSGSGRLYALDASSGVAQWTYDTAAAVGARTGPQRRRTDFLRLRCHLCAELRRRARVEQDSRESGVEPARLGRRRWRVGAA